ncbi:methylglyoxal reductase (NADPH-dependent) gre2 [Saitozyma podzolica]|uniref:Methylglyoxal reductase (NADPH-dependent) gre2 n=1 Tax=Saitozyma podzolica TaxID=1890683 RepID=A0A427YC37_9TREE|nr:methylglyoxal reductase (NADPH-dependent) gre2 [Saitozyma podzolica]
MPTISKGDYVLVTGASGFLGAHTALAFLEAGYRVRGTVRSKSKGEYLVKLFAGKGEFDYVLVDDITREGAFDEAVKGVDAVAHTASPVVMSGAVEPKELLDPAIKGTTGVLESIEKVNPGIKRVVITSSFMAMFNMYPGTYRYTEKDWNEISPAHVEENGAQSWPFHSYNTSKVLAEKAFWKFIEDKKPSWEGVAINPSWILGPIIHDCDSPEKLNESIALFYPWAAGKMTEKDLPGQVGLGVHVKDVTLAHIRALEVPEAAGERFLTSSHTYTSQDYVDILHKHFLDLPNVPVGQPETYEERSKEYPIGDSSKLTRVLGITLTPFGDIVVDMTKSLRERFNF